MDTNSPANSRNKLGFSLIELLAVVTILGIVAAIVVPRISGYGMQAKQHMCDQFKSDLNSALERYLFDHGKFPSTLDDLRKADYYPEAIPTCPVDNSDYEFDAKTGRITGHVHS